MEALFGEREDSALWWIFDVLRSELRKSRSCSQRGVVELLGRPTINGLDECTDLLQMYYIARGEYLRVLRARSYNRAGRDVVFA
mgnify:CR=1 FL=1